LVDALVFQSVQSESEQVPFKQMLRRLGMIYL